MNLTDINGIGKSTATKFNEVGVETIEDLAQFDNPDDFDFTVKQEWIDDAKEITSPAPEPTEPQESSDTTDVESTDNHESPTQPEETAEVDEEIMEPDAEIADEAVTDETPEQEDRDLIDIQFKIESGDHKGKNVSWKESNPSVVIGNTGQYIALSAIGVTKIEDEDDITRFKFTWGGTVGSAELPTDVFDIFSAAVKKKASSTVLGTFKQVGSVVMNTAKSGLKSAFGGCSGCGS